MLIKKEEVIVKKNIKSFNSTFTLAEILITLGIIGIISAMTIPNLIGNIMGYQRAIKYKKVLSTLNNAIRMNKANYEWDLADLNTFCGNSGNTHNPEITHSICAVINGSIKGAQYYYDISNLKNSNDETYPVNNFHNPLSSVSNIKKLPTYIFQDGSMLMLSNSIGKYPCTKTIEGGLKSAYRSPSGAASACYGYIDINGIKGPNKYTRCKTGTLALARRINNLEPNCIINKKNIGDIFSVIFYDSTAEPIYDNDWAVLNITK